MKKKYLSFIFLISLLFAQETNTTNFEAIEVQAQEQNSVFAPQDYLESQTYLKAAPAQKRLSITEAMNIPGIQGDPIKAIKILSGVTSAGSSGNIIIHASKANETIYTINHLPVGYLFHFNNFHSIISPEATDQLDLYLGAFDNTYNNAMGAVLDITPKYPVGGNSGFIHVGLFDSSFGFDFGITENTSLFIGARRSYFDLFLPLFTNGGNIESEEDNTSFQITQFPAYYDTTLMLTHIMGNHQFSYEMILADDKFKSLLDGNVADPKANGPLDLAIGFITNGLRWKYEDQNYQANTLLYYLFTYQRVNVFNQKVTADTHFGGLKHISTYTTEKHEITGGFETQAYYVPLDFNITAPTPSDVPRTRFTSQPVIHLEDTFKAFILTLFAQDVYSFADDWKVRYGLTYAYSSVENLKNAVDPRFALVYNLTPDDEFSFSTGSYTQSPNPNFILEKIGNPLLNFEYAYHFNGHYKHTFKEGHSIEIEPYYKRLYQLAITDTTNVPSKNYLSVGEGSAKGIDLTYKLQTDELYILGSYTWSNSYRQLYSNSTTFYPFADEIPHTLNLVGSYKLSENWSLSGLVTLKSGGRYTPITGGVAKTYADDNSTYYDPIYGSEHSAQLPTYFTLNVKLAYTQHLSKDQRIEYSFELLNATDHKNIVGYQYEDDFSDYNNPTEVLDLPRIPWFDITYHF